MQENTVSVLEAAKLLGVGRDTVYRLIKAERPQCASEIARAAIAVHDRPRQSRSLRPRGGPLSARRRPRQVAVLQS